MQKLVDSLLNIAIKANLSLLSQQRFAKYAN